MSWFANMGWIEYSVILVILLMVSIAIGDYLEDILSWIKLQWKDALPLKRVYIVVASIIGFPLFILFIILYSQLFLVPLGISTLELSDIDSGFALAFLGTVTAGVALFSGFLAILRSEEDKNQNKIAKSESEIADKQAITAEQGQITERLNKATENLGKSTADGEPIIEVRIGALYALERIAQDSIRDHIQILEILCAYIRNGSLKNKKDKTENPTEDVQAALTIIGRRHKWPESAQRVKIETDEEFRINLNGCYLHGAKLGKASLINASFIGTKFRKAFFNRTDLSNAALGSADLTGAWFEETILQDTKLGAAITEGTWSYEGDFSKCLGLIQDQLDLMFLAEGIDVPDGLARPKHNTDYDNTYNTFNEFMDTYNEWIKEQNKK